MKQMFNLVAILLCLSGVLHLVKVFAYPIDPNSSVAVILSVLFGLAYLVIGILIFRTAERRIWAGVVVPSIGLLLTLIGMKPDPDWFTIAFVLLDVVIIAVCVYLIIKGRAPIRRVS
jgi:hypothetical protein